jgi:hypothetical protein
VWVGALPRLSTIAGLRAWVGRRCCFVAIYWPTCQDVVGSADKERKKEKKGSGEEKKHRRSGRNPINIPLPSPSCAAATARASPPLAVLDASLPRPSAAVWTAPSPSLPLSRPQPSVSAEARRGIPFIRRRTDRLKNRRQDDDVMAADSRGPPSSYMPLSLSLRGNEWFLRGAPFSCPPLLSTWFGRQAQEDWLTECLLHETCLWICWCTLPLIVVIVGYRYCKRVFSDEVPLLALVIKKSIHGAMVAATSRHAGEACPVQTRPWKLQFNLFYLHLRIIWHFFVVDTQFSF